MSAQGAVAWLQSQTPAQTTLGPQYRDPGPTPPWAVKDPQGQFNFADTPPVVEPPATPTPIAQNSAQGAVNWLKAQAPAPELSLGTQTAEVARGFGQGIVRDAGEFFGDVSDIATDLFKLKLGQRPEGGRGLFDESPADITREKFYKERTDPYLEPRVDLDRPEYDQLQNLVRGSRFAGSMVAPGKAASVASDMLKGAGGATVGSGLTDTDMGALIGGVSNVLNLPKTLAKYGTKAALSPVSWIPGAMRAKAGETAVSPKTEKVQDLLGKVIDRYAGDKTAAASRIQESMDRGEYSTLGHMSKDPELQAFEEGLAKSNPELANKLTASMNEFFESQKQAARVEIAGDTLEDIIPAAEGRISQAETAIPRQEVKSLEVAEADLARQFKDVNVELDALAEADKLDLLRMKGDIEKRVEPTRRRGVSPATASETVYKHAAKAKVAAKDRLDVTWDAVPGDVRVSTYGLEAEIAYRLKNTLDRPEYNSFMKKVNKDVDEQINLLDVYEHPKHIASTRGFLRNLAQDHKDSTGNIAQYVVRGLDIAQDAVREILLKHPNTSTQYRKAIDESFKFHDTFDATHLNPAYKRGEKGQHTFAKRVTPKGEAGATATDELLAIDETGEVMEAVDDYLRSQFEVVTRNSRGEFNPSAAEDFFNPNTQYGELLNRRPKLKDELTGVTRGENVLETAVAYTADKLKARGDVYEGGALKQATDAKTTAVSKAQVKAKTRTAKLTASATAKLARASDPVEHMQTVIRSPLRKTQLNELVRSAKKTGTYDALNAATVEAVMAEIIKDTKLSGGGIKAAAIKYTNTWKKTLLDTEAITKKQAESISKLVDTGTEMAAKARIQGVKFDYAGEPAVKKFAIGFLAAGGARMMPMSTLKSTAAASSLATKKLLLEPNLKTLEALGELMANPGKYPKVVKKVTATRTVDETVNVLADALEGIRKATRPARLAAPFTELDEDEETK